MILYDFQYLVGTYSDFCFTFFRTSLDKLEKISQTDIACVWSTQKKETQEKYKAVPIDEMPCFKNKTEDIVIDDNVLRTIRSNMLSALPFSAAALHKSVLIEKQ